MMNIHQRIARYSKEHQLFNTATTLVLGLSGGPDSVFLLHVLAQLRDEQQIKSLIAVHLDHQWRENSGNDVVFCAELAQKYNVPFVASTIAQLPITFENRGSKEDLGRQARRYFFEQVRQAHHSDAIALAHHRDDQQETFFLRLLRGASLAGLTGIKPRQDAYVRPLLELSKQEIITFLNEQNIPYLIDPSNTSDEFLRNRIRSHAIPALRSCDERFDTTFGHTLEQLHQAHEYLEHHALEMFDTIAMQENGIYAVHLKKFAALPLFMQKQILVLWMRKQQVKFPVSSGFFDEALKFLVRPGSKEHAIHPTWHLVKDKEYAKIICR